MSALVCFAVPQEARPFQRLVEDRNDVQVLVTGMGTANARRAVAAVIQKREPRHIFTCGFAGALNSELRIGDADDASQCIISGGGKASAGIRLRGDIAGKVIPVFQYRH